ncbi:MAG: hypothetical protein CMM50_06495 [Rhodospirillaceae bacterium]|nr:hypothetical protein [Rhodospirillaceae bacterium]|tara:strand:+ start:434 stop:2002 length:1569 start_codon:yes stop_codon:yes gene_type:complete
MSRGFRQTMVPAHTWAGLTVGWMLYFIFLTGTAGYFDTEIDRWMRPEIPFAETFPSRAEMLMRAEKRLGDVAPDAHETWIFFPDKRSPFLEVSWENADHVWHEEMLDPETGAPIRVRDTGGGQFLYQLHYRLHYLPPVLAFWLVSACAMFMLVAICTGVIVHKKIFADLFTFRPRKGQRSWLDAHNVLGVTALPFHLMITYSGLVFLMFTTMPVLINAFYGSGPEGQTRFFIDALSRPTDSPPAGVAAQTRPLTEFLSEAERRWGEGSVRYISVENAGDVNAVVEVNRSASGGLGTAETLLFHGATGERRGVVDQPAGANVLRVALLNLHEGLFADTVLRWLYFLSGLAGTAMIATGLHLWTVKRRQKNTSSGTPPAIGLSLVERLNIGTIVGLPVGIAAYFWANRLLPLEMDGRAAWEIHTMFLTWVATFAVAAWRRRDGAWLELSGLAAAAYGLLPVVNAVATDRGLIVSIARGDWVFAAFDLAAVAVGLFFLLLVRAVRRKRLQAATGRISEAAMEAPG